MEQSNITTVLAELQRDLDSKIKGYPKHIEQGKLTADEAVNRINRLKEAIGIIEFHGVLLTYIQTAVEQLCQHPGNFENPETSIALVKLEDFKNGIQ